LPKKKQAIHAKARNGAAIINTALIPSTNACFKAFTPESMTTGVTPGMLGGAVALSEARALTKAGGELLRSPARRAASAI
jgi:hypothetical protein